MRRGRTTRIGAVDQLVGALLALSYIALLFLQSPELGMSRDESFYVIAAQDYAGWIEQFVTGEGAMAQEVIDPAWDYNHEHPGLAKALFAISWLAHQKYELFPDDSTAFRFPGMVLSGLLLWLIYLFGARIFGRTAGLFAAVAFALMPRPFYHAHLCCFDVPITFALTLATYAYWRSLTSRRWAFGFGIAFGIALAIKHNAWILPGVLLIHFLWMIVEQRRRGLPLEDPRRVSARPWWMLSMGLLGPAVFLLTWPWLWNDTLARLGWYVRFHTGHEYYNIAYLGTTWFRPPFPVHYPVLMTWFTVPMVTLALAAYGLRMRFRAALPSAFTSRYWRRGKATPDPRCTDVLLIGSLLAPIVVIALPSSPIFGGTKHWMPAYPFIAIYAGFGFWRLSEHLKELLRARLGTRRRLESWATAGAFVALMLPSAQAAAHSHPYGLSHYTFAAGGVPGAADLGLNRQFWGFTTGSLTEFFKERLPDGGTVWLCDTTDIAWRMLQRDGLIPANIRGSWSLSRADLVMVHHEDHFAEIDAQAWVAFGDASPLHVLTYDGVPIISIYANPTGRAMRDEGEQP
ncbi:MAG: glycosyltransferase family 39 protein [Myxococcota bacterium]